MTAPVDRFAAPAVSATWLGIIEVAGQPPPERIDLGSAGGGDLRLSLAERSGRCWLAAELHVVPSAATVASRRASRTGIPEALAAGVLSVSAPLTPGRRLISLRYDGARLELHVDGVLQDEEWPLGAVLPAPDGPRTPGWRAWPTALDDRRLADWHGRELTDPAATGPFAAAYWRPAGHNTGVGDVMLAADGDDLHLLWLFDRRGHGSRWWGGAHQFRHAVSSDLQTWRHLPHALEIRRPWEGYGTGMAVIDDNRTWHLVYQIHGERFAEGAGQAGIWTAVSADGRTWHEHVARCPGGGDPTVFRAHGRWHLVAWGRRHESDDLRSWTLADPAFLPVGPLPGGPWPEEPPGVARWDGDNTLECPCVWTFNGWSYALMGRTGFWMSRDPLGPYWSRDGVGIAQPRWDLYDGLFVPMATVWRGRCILAGWLRGDQNWGGVLVWRELIQEADGTLAMRWLPELTPSSEPFHPLPADGSLPAGSWRMEADLAAGDGAVELRFGDEAALVIEPAQSAVRWSTPAGAGPTPVPAPQPIAYGREVAIRSVEGLTGSIRIEVVGWRDRDGWVLDACIGGRRTLVCYRPKLAPRLALADLPGAARITAMRVATLRQQA